MAGRGEMQPDNRATGEVAACGLDCAGCDIRLVPLDRRAAQRVVAWFHEMKWLEAGEGVDEAIARRMYCQGCHGDRTLHWSADCAILICCVDERGLDLCSECDDFPCTLLTDRAETNASYAHGVQRLQAMRSH